MEASTHQENRKTHPNKNRSNESTTPPGKNKDPKKPCSKTRGSNHSPVNEAPIRERTPENAPITPASRQIRRTSTRIKDPPDAYPLPAALKMVGRAGIEPATAATSRRCHTTRPPAPNTVGYRTPTVYMLRPQTNPTSSRSVEPRFRSTSSDISARLRTPSVKNSTTDPTDLPAGCSSPSRRSPSRSSADSRFIRARLSSFLKTG